MTGCANCSREVTTICCEACHNGLDVFGQSIYGIEYYNTDCQRQHWPEHIYDCYGLKYRRQLYRAGELLQNIFLVMQREAFVHPIGRVRDGGWIRAGDIKVGRMLQLRRRFATPSELMFGMVNFPEHLFPDMDDQHSVLALHACSEAVSRMVPLFASALYGTYDKIEHVVLVGPGKILRPRFDGDRGDPQSVYHEVLKVTLRDGHEYAFDLAGAQYGFYQTVTPWKQYLDLLGAAPVPEPDQDPSEKGPGLITKHTARYAASGGAPWIEGRDMVLMAAEWVARFVRMEVESWFDKKKQSMPDFIHLPEAECRQGICELTVRIRRTLCEFVAWFKKGGSIFTLFTEPEDEKCDTDTLEKFFGKDAETPQMLLRVALVKEVPTLPLVFEE